MPPRAIATRPSTFLALVMLATVGIESLQAEDQPQWGERDTRNMVSAEKGLPVDFDPGRLDPMTGRLDVKTTRNVRWIASLGRQTHGSPIVAEGKVFVGTNNDVPRNERLLGDRGVLMCFDEATGKFLWQLVVPKLFEIKNADWYYVGLTSPPTVRDGRAYLVSNRCEVLCLDTDGMADGNDGPFVDEGRHAVYPGEKPIEPGPTDADVVWTFDMAGRLGVAPHNASNCSILVDGNFLYVCTSNGVEWQHEKVANPEAPTLVVVDRRDGSLVARDDFNIGPDIIHGQWSSPVLVDLGNRRCVCLGCGNGVLYAVEPVTDEDAQRAKKGETVLLKNVWKFNGHPLAQTQDDVPIEHGHNTRSYEVVGMPVFHENRLYVPFTQDGFHNRRLGWLTCLDPSQKGDVTRSALVWSHEDCGASVSTVAVADGLAYCATFWGELRCLDARTGELYWTHPAGGPIWGSPLVADGKVYLGTGRLALWVLEAGKELKVLGHVRMRDRIFTTPTAANGTLYVATFRSLYAIAQLGSGDEN